MVVDCMGRCAGRLRDDLPKHAHTGADAESYGRRNTSRPAGHNGATCRRREGHTNAEPDANCDQDGYSHGDQQADEHVDVHTRAQRNAHPYRDTYTRPDP